MLTEWRGTGALLLAACALACGACTTGSAGNADCEAFAARVAECTGSDPGDMTAYCEANADTIGLLAAMDCDALEGDAGKADGWLGWKELGEACTLNAECEGVLVCRTVRDPLAHDPRSGSYDAMYPTLCLPRASHAGVDRADRFCDGWGDADCVEGDVCVDGSDATSLYPLFPRYLGTCEAGTYGQPCACPDGAAICLGEEAGCGTDLVCVHGTYDRDVPAGPATCMRPCVTSIECQGGCGQYFAQSPDVEELEGVYLFLGDYCF